MDEDKLINLVRKYEELYDRTNPKYSDNDHKDKIWKIIGRELNTPGKNKFRLKYILLYPHINFDLVIVCFLKNIFKKPMGRPLCPRKF